MERLQKVMAQAGVASRRHCEEMIREGLVSVNGKVCTELPILVDTARDRIRVAGRRLHVEPKVYFLLHKPKKVVCTNYDPQGRRRAVDLLTGVKQRVYPVGRLDTDSRGLLILTNDGELTEQLTHPRHGVVKTYVAEISGLITAEQVDQLKKGMYFESGKATAERVKILRRGPKRSLLEIALREGRNRQIRRMLSRLGHPVQELTRVRIGPLTLRGLGPGKFRPLQPKEVQRLRLAGKTKRNGTTPTP
ncbi:MAG: rRNA pseudouridine synthase [Sedimentisphaerales bacterium]|nr:rRNA pseudouridine synthase [Sedimentisphaerales bacterium]